MIPFFNINRSVSVVLFLIIIFVFPVLSEDAIEGSDPAIAPIISYDSLSLAEQDIKSGGAAAFLSKDNFSLISAMQYHRLGDDPGAGYKQDYYTFDLLFDGREERHQVLVITKGESDRPYSGGWHTFQIGVAWGYEIVAREGFSLALGAGLGISDFGLTLPGGEIWPVIPLPLIRMNTEGTRLRTKFEFLTGPNFSFTAAPKGRLRLNGDFRMDKFDSVRDIIFDANLEYRLFPSEHVLSELAGLKIGFKGDQYGYDLSRDGDSVYTLSYYAGYGMLDLSLLQLTWGYAFAGEESVFGSSVREVEDGFMFSVQLAYQF